MKLKNLFTGDVITVNDRYKAFKLLGSGNFIELKNEVNIVAQPDELNSKNNATVGKRTPKNK